VRETRGRQEDIPEKPLEETDDKAYAIYVISDALGETAEFVCRAATAQFSGLRTRQRRIPYIQTTAQIDQLLDEAAEEDAILLYTLVVDSMRDYLQHNAEERGLIAVDILGSLIKAISIQTKRTPKSSPNILHRLDEQYYKKIEAVEFAVKYDDGKDPRGVMFADVVLIGVSRTSKTPLCMYLAHKGIKAANIPLIPEVAPPRELFVVPAKKVFGLILDPAKLNQIRSERIKTIGLGAVADYANIERIMEELRYAEQIIKKIGCMSIDTTNRAVEETASIILKKLYKGEEAQ